MNNETIKIESVNNYLGIIKKIIKIAVIIAIISGIVWFISDKLYSNYLEKFFDLPSSYTSKSPRYQYLDEKVDFYSSLNRFRFSIFGNKW